MIVDHLILRNFGPYRKELQLDFSGKKVVGIVAPNEMGKSHILRAICFGIYGKIPLKQDVHKVRDVQLINDNADGDLTVEVGVKLPDRSITIQRGRTQNNEGFIKLDGKPYKMAEAQEVIAETIRLSYTDFTSLSYFVQGDLHQFMLGDKAAYFRRWTTSLSLWYKLSEAFRGDVAHLQQERAKSASQAGSLALTVQGLESARSDLKAAERRLAGVQAKVDRVNEAVSDISAQIKAHEHDEKVRATILDLKKQLSDLSNQNKMMSSRLETVDQEIDKVSDGTCPILDVSCKRLEKSGAKKRRELNLEIGELKDELEANEERQNELRAKGKKLVKATKKRSPVSQLKSDLLDAIDARDKATMELKVAHSGVAKADAKVDAAKKAKVEIKLCNKRIGVLATKIRRARFLQWMCGNSGIPTQIMESELERVEDKCNWILERLDYPKQIRFAASRELISYEPICPVCGSDDWVRKKRTCKKCGLDQPHKRKDEPSVTVWDGTRERPFALESGGGQTLQSFAVRLAGSLFVASMLGIDLRMVMLDEVFAHLDTANRQKLMSLVIDKLSNEFGLKQQLVVSHHEDVISCVDHMLVVTKEHGSSVARWE
jgi:DNA repair exonuclease SbcCD ATPase subunit